MQTDNINTDIKKIMQKKARCPTLLIASMTVPSTTNRPTGVLTTTKYLKNNNITIFLYFY